MRAKFVIPWQLQFEGLQAYVAVMQQYWAADPGELPTFTNIVVQLQ